MDKKTFYITVGSREISQFQDASPYDLEIEATDEEVRELRELFDEMYAADWMSFWRAHVPYVQYHYDKENELIDNDLKKVYQKLYDLGKPETKTHIESMGILDQ